MKQKEEKNDKSLHYQVKFSQKISAPVEVLELVSAEQRCFTDFKFISAIWRREDVSFFLESVLFRTEKFKAGQHWAALFQKEPALNQLYSVVNF